jgi:hypothetical protein
MRDNAGVQDLFTVLIVVVVGVAAVVALITLVGTGRAYDEIGRGRMSLGDEDESPEAGAAHRDVEIRQMLEARNARRARRGEPPLDLDAELARLQRPAVDPALAAEVRQLVEARNARRLRQGRKPLDVEAEVRRRLADIAGT